MSRTRPSNQPIERIVQEPAYEYVHDNTVVGKGSFGVVSRARRAHDGHLVAIKRVLQDPRYINREFDILKVLKHPNVVELLDHYYIQRDGDADATKNGRFLCIIMDYLPHSLSSGYYQFLSTPQFRQVPPKIIKLYMYQLCRGLGYLHSMGYCHRDIKPQNVLVDDKTHVLKLCDFGSAKALIPGETSISYICSRYYRAPELLCHSTNYTNAVDVWSIGCVMAEMIRGKPVFQGTNNVDQMVAVVNVLGSPTTDELNAMNKHFTQFTMPVRKGKNWQGLFPSSETETIERLVNKHLAYEKQEQPSQTSVIEARYAAQKEYLATMYDPQMLPFLEGLLTYDPTKRLTPYEAMCHPYFDELRSNPYITFPVANPSGSSAGSSASNKEVHPPALFDFIPFEWTRFTPSQRTKLLPEWLRHEFPRLERQREVEEERIRIQQAEQQAALHYAQQQRELERRQQAATAAANSQQPQVYSQNHQ